ncbi:MAG: ImmA/IrrE family metallo-endopeptidase, partial [Cyclobacteriaceae bacterium]|nr:ImmA/IrrE family metallo-endopeptidase [Cyclobacteriaceae bacterium]
QDVFYPFLEVSEGRNWTMKTVRTGGLSFPTYSYVNSIPAPFRGVITITNLQRPDRLRSTVAHEIGHKVMNVSHEYKSTDPGHEIYAEGGLMLYGDGEDIPSGEEGRWHLERLHLSPFIYKLNEQGVKIWNEEYKEGGHYYDPLYGDKVIRFKGKAEIDSDW